MFLQWMITLVNHINDHGVLSMKNCEEYGAKGINCEEYDVNFIRVCFPFGHTLKEGPRYAS